MANKASKNLIRDLNSNLVLQTMIFKRPISRADLAKETGLTKVTISTIVQDLLDRELLIEIGYDNTARGRKPTLLDINAKAGYAISINIEVEDITAIHTDLLGENLMTKNLKTPKESELPETLSSIINEMIASQNDSPYGLVGIALGIHGVVKGNRIMFTPNYNLVGMDLYTYLKEEFKTNIYLENEANLSVIGESLHLSDEYQNIANISVHSGVGLGLLIDRKLYKGFSGYAGEIGHTIIEPNGRPCQCGNAGCLEQYVSRRSLVNSLRMKKNNHRLDFNSLVTLYKTGDSDAKETIKNFVNYMTICVNNILNSYNPDVIIINSTFTDAFPRLVRDISKSLNSRLNDVVNILPSNLNSYAILLGGITMVVKNFTGVDDVRFSPKKT